MFLLSLVGCGAVGPYRAYSVDQLSAYSVTTLEGSQYLHQDWVNHYVDVMRFAPVDRKVIVDSAEHEPIKIKSVSHETAVYFCWAWVVPVVSLLPGALRGCQRVHVADPSP